MDKTFQVRFVVYTGTIIYANRPDLSGHRESLWWNRGPELTPFATKVKELEAQGYTVCQDPESLKRGQAHAREVRKHFEGEGKPERWVELVKEFEATWPGFRVVPEKLAPIVAELAAQEEVSAKAWPAGIVPD